MDGRWGYLGQKNISRGRRENGTNTSWESRYLYIFVAGTQGIIPNLISGHDFIGAYMHPSGKVLGAAEQSIRSDPGLVHILKTPDRLVRYSC